MILKIFWKFFTNEIHLKSIVNVHYCVLGRIYNGFIGFGCMDEDVGAGKLLGG
jgi:hypothetical protein